MDLVAICILSSMKDFNSFSCLVAWAGTPSTVWKRTGESGTLTLLWVLGASVQSLSIAYGVTCAFPTQLSQGREVLVLVC